LEKKKMKYNKTGKLKKKNQTTKKKEGVGWGGL